jgi:hypothetical protein
MRLALPASLLLSLLLGASLPARQGEKKAEPAEKSFQDRIAQFLAEAREPDRPEALKGLRPAEKKETVKALKDVEGAVTKLDARLVKFNKAKGTVTMEVREKEGVKLTAKERDQVEEDVQKLLSYAVYKYQGGLVKPDEVKLTLKTEVKPYAPPLPPPGRAAVPTPTPGVTPQAARPYYVWYWVPAPCGSCWPGYWCYVWVYPAAKPVPRAAAAAPAKPVARQAPLLPPPTEYTATARAEKAPGGR